MDTKALRQKILDLAIRGKLVPQDPNDEPASVLLERIRQQKQQMVKEGKLKAKDIKNDSIIFVGEDNLHYEKFADGTVKCIEDEIPFEIPENWAWARLPSITLSIFAGGDKPEGSTRFRTEQNKFPVYSNGIDNDGLYGFCSFPKVVLPSITVSARGTVGHCCIRHTPFTPIVRLITVIPTTGATTEYLKLVFDFFLEGGTGTSIPQLTVPSISLKMVPVPPLGEQIKITQLCDIIFKRLNYIESEKADIGKIIMSFKSNILDLAIRGKLVPQDPNDEPASVLLERIRAEKEELIKQGKIKRDKKESVIFKGDDNSYYLKAGEAIESLEQWGLDDIPDSWSVCCLGELCDYGSCKSVNDAEISDSAWILELEDIEKDTGTVLQKVRKSTRNAVSAKHLFHRGQVLYSKLRPYLNKVVLADEDGYCTSEIIPLEFERNIYPPYARYYLMSPSFLSYANKCSYGVKMPRLGTADGNKAVFLVPPIEEQRRIVNAIDGVFYRLSSIAESIS